MGPKGRGLPQLGQKCFYGYMRGANFEKCDETSKIALLTALKFGS